MQVVHVGSVTKIKSSTVVRSYSKPFYPIILEPGYTAIESNPVEYNYFEDQTLTIDSSDVNINSGSSLKMVEPAVSETDVAYYTPQTTQVESFNDLVDFEVLYGRTVEYGNPTWCRVSIYFKTNVLQ